MRSPCRTDMAVFDSRDAPFSRPLSPNKKDSSTDRLRDHGAANRTRTCDPIDGNDALYRTMRTLPSKRRVRWDSFHLSLYGLPCCNRHEDRSTNIKYTVTRRKTEIPRGSFERSAEFSVCIHVSASGVILPDAGLPAGNGAAPRSPPGYPDTRSKNPRCTRGRPRLRDGRYNP